MLEASEVVGRARGYLNSIMPEFVASNPEVDEMVYLQDTARWRITFISQVDLDKKVESLADVIRRRTVEKVVELDADNGALFAVRNPPPF